MKIEGNFRNDVTEVITHNLLSLLGPVSVFTQTPEYYNFYLQLCIAAAIVFLLGDICDLYTTKQVVSHPNFAASDIVEANSYLPEKPSPLKLVNTKIIILKSLFLFSAISFPPQGILFGFGSLMRSVKNLYFLSSLQKS